MDPHGELNRGLSQNRRSFLKDAAIISSGLFLIPGNISSLAASAGKFLERIGISTSIANNGILAEAGYAFVEENVRNFLVPSDAESVFEEKLSLIRQSKLPVEACNVFLPGNLKCTGPAIFHDDIAAWSETAFRRAKAAGVKTIVFGSGGARAIPEGFSKEEAKKQFIGLCSRISPIAKKYDIVISLEPLNRKECNFINSVAEGAEIVQAVDHKNFRLLADIYHMLMENESPAEIVKYGNLLYHTHIAEKTGRTAPGVNNEDFIPYFKALKEVKFAGRMAIECSWKNIEEQASPALKVIRTQLASV
jgi:sugar phosphate isomerase/epimerase